MCLAPPHPAAKVALEVSSNGGSDFTNTGVQIEFTDESTTTDGFADTAAAVSTPEPDLVHANPATAASSGGTIVGRC